MPSSISNSEQAQVASGSTATPAKAHRGIFFLLVGLVAIWLASEAGTMLAVHRVSKIMRRTQMEYRDAERLQRYSPDGKPTMLLYGNSLLLEGVDYPGLKKELSGEYDVHRLIFEQTEYLEQYYVLRRLFRRGAAPHDLVICLSVSHLIGDDIRGEFMGVYMDSTDIVRLGSRRHMDATSISGLLFAHFSEWFADRAETRKAVLGAALPDMRDLATRLAWVRVKPADPAAIKEVATPRLLEMKKLCDQYGVRLTVLVPPTLAKDRTDVLEEAATAAGVRVLVPVAPGGMNESFFRDGFHLNQAGAAIFTAKLASELPQRAE